MSEWLMQTEEVPNLALIALTLNSFAMGLVGSILLEKWTK